jgi:hypothetical protein
MPPWRSLRTVRGFLISCAISAARRPSMVRRSFLRRDSSLMKTRE